VAQTFSSQEDEDIFLQNLLLIFSHYLSHNIYKIQKQNFLFDKTFSLVELAFISANSLFSLQSKYRKTNKQQS